MQVTTQDQEVIIEQVKEFAIAAHGKQKRKYSGERYFAHVLRVMNTCYLHWNTLPILAAALLHDVLEDTKVTENEMREFLHSIMVPDDAEHTLSIVIELTDVYTKKQFPELDRRERKLEERERLISVSPEAQTIKYADIIDNSMNVVEHDPGFARVFLKEYRDLLREMNKGEQVLYREAVKTVVDCLVRLDNRISYQ
jgi:guanosine-3',5'-bis(diphosphate) 3'-pyrophosphohydrolase